MSFLRKLNPLNVLQPKSQPIMPTQLYAYKTRFAMLGPPGSGKTTVSSQNYLAAQVLSSDQEGFFCRILEGTSSILDAVSNLKQGHFPRKTEAHVKTAAESGLLLRQKAFMGEKKVQVPMVDIAGEDLDLIVGETYRATTQNISPVAYSLAKSLTDYVKDSDGYIVCVDSSRALGIKGYNVPTDQIQQDPDNYLHRLLSNIFTHKERSRGKPIKGMAVIITKWDTIAPYASLWGMDVYNDAGLKEFMDVCFPNTSMILKDYGFGLGANIKIFPSYIEVERNSDGTAKRWQDGSEKIIVKERRMPSCDLQSYINLMRFLLEFAT